MSLISAILLRAQDERQNMDRGYRVFVVLDEKKGDVVAYAEWGRYAKLLQSGGQRRELARANATQKGYELVCNEGNDQLQAKLRKGYRPVSDHQHLTPYQMLVSDNPLVMHLDDKAERERRANDVSRAERLRTHSAQLIGGGRRAPFDF